MEARAMKERPPYPLLTAVHTVEADFYQMPRWLLARQDLSLDAKLVYMLLYDRFRLSQKNGWVNEQGEVYLVYPRQELVEALGIGRKRITAAMRELMAAALVWEHNGGYSVANRIYLAWGEPVEMSEDKLSTSCGEPSFPFGNLAAIGAEMDHHRGQNSPYIAANLAP